MQMQIVGQHFHAYITISIQILIDPDVSVHVVAIVIYKMMQLKTWWAAPHRIARTGECRSSQEERYQQRYEQDGTRFLHRHLLLCE
jgi:hypothetical protein